MTAIKEGWQMRKVIDPQEVLAFYVALTTYHLKVSKIIHSLDTLLLQDPICNARAR
jgi:hypothetical protein